jgi:phosphoglucomutase
MYEIMSPKEKAEFWLSQNLDQDTNDAIEELLSGDENELIESFYKDLEFGTGGLRGIMGVGSNRMNKYTIGMANQGLANYILKSFPNQETSVAIAFDSRNNSPYFAQITANVLSANGIKVYIFEELRPTPELSFAIRHYKCKAGVMVTASHNPKEYNGYKAYWDDGAQLTPPHDENVIDEVKAITGFDQIKFDPIEENIVNIGPEVDELYVKNVVDLALQPDIIAQNNDVRIVFSSIHGTGITMVPRVLNALGFKQVDIVEEQAEPDGNFPTVVYPNPEESEALTLALKLAEKVDADVLMATDPDADRVGIAIKNHKGEFMLINGNQLASLLVFYILKARTEMGALDQKRHYMVKTIVTTELIDTMCAAYGIDCFNTLTGFKYIATVIRELEGEREFIGGGEESYGFMTSETVRDKDAVATCALIAEMTAFAKSQGKGVIDLLDEMYLKHGLWYESMTSITKQGKAGAEEISQMMQDFRAKPPKSLGGTEVTTIRDYQTGTETDLRSGNKTTLDFPKSNVLQFITADGSKISARPSGTEPKIKFYFSVTEKISNLSELENSRAGLQNKVEQILSDLI